MKKLVDKLFIPFLLSAIISFGSCMSAPSNEPHPPRESNPPREVEAPWYYYDPVYIYIRGGEIYIDVDRDGNGCTDLSYCFKIKNYNSELDYYEVMLIKIGKDINGDGDFEDKGEVQYIRSDKTYKIPNPKK